MKKLMLLTAAVAVFAQTASAKIGLGVEAGVNMASWNAKLDDTKMDTKSLTGFKVGAIVDLPLVGSLSLQPGVFYSAKGTQMDMDILGTKVEMKNTVSYIEVPVNAIYDFNVGPGNLFVGAGPYIAFAMSGKTKVDDQSEDIKFGSNDDELKSMDFGANVNAGYKLPLGLFLRLNYGMGLSNLSNTSGETIKNGVFSVSLGYMFL